MSLPDLQYGAWSCSAIPRSMEDFSLRTLRDYKNFAFPAQVFQDAFESSNEEEWAKFEPIALYYIMSCNGLLYLLNGSKGPDGRRGISDLQELKRFRKFLLPPTTIKPQFSLDRADAWITPEAFELYQFQKRYKLLDLILGTHRPCSGQPGVLLPPPPSLHKTALKSAEAKSIDDILIQDAAQLLELDRELEDAKGTVNTLLHQRQQVLSHMNQYRQLISPIWHLPLELLGEIFRHCVPNALERGWMSRGHQRHVIISLSHVCRRWRGVALGTPHLWTAVDVGRPSRSQRNDPNAHSEISYATTWLSRTGKLPISLKLCQSMYEWRGETSALVSRHCDQLEHLELHNPRAILMAGRRVDYPRLRTLILSGAGSVQGFSSPLKLMTTAPELRTLKLAFHIVPHYLEIPWIQLTELSLTHQYYDADECVQLLRLAPNVKKCELRLGSRGDHQNEIVCAPMLESLVLTAIEDCEHLFGFTRFPSLNELDICIAGEGCWAPMELESLLTRSSCSLYRLKIVVLDDDSCYWIEHEEGSLEGCLEQIPSLVELELPTNKQLNEGLLERLTMNAGEPSTLSFLPNLQILRFYHGMSDADEDWLLLRMLQSRWKDGITKSGIDDHITPLKTVEIIGLDEGVDEANFMDPEVLQVMSRLADDGLNIYASDVNGDCISLKNVLDHPMGSLFFQMFHDGSSTDGSIAIDSGSPDS